MFSIIDYLFIRCVFVDPSSSSASTTTSKPQIGIQNGTNVGVGMGVVPNGTNMGPGMGGLPFGYGNTVGRNYGFKLDQLIDNDN